VSVPERRHQCPCCDYYTLGDRAAYEICPVCYWEDDGQDLDQLEVVSGANHITLREARTNYAAIGACDQAALSLVASAGDVAGLRREVRATFH